MNLKKLTDSVPLSRLILYVMILCLVPVFAAGYFVRKQKKAWETVSEQLIAFHYHAQLENKKQSINRSVRELFSKCDHRFLENNLEPLTLLAKERTALEQFMQSASYTKCEPVEKRYAFLKGAQNRMKFVEGEIVSGENAQETKLNLAHTVEVDTVDLQEILERIEGDFPQKPQLLVTQFALNKKAHPGGNEVFELNINLLKREFYQ